MQLFKSDLTVQSLNNMLQESKSISKSFVYFTFIISIVAWELSITLAILLASQNYVGFNGNTNLSATCTIAYFISKETALSEMVETSFLGSLLSMAIFTVIFPFMLVWLIRVCKGGNPNISITKANKFILFILTNIAILAEIPSLGYYLGHIVQLVNCTSTYNSTQIIIIIVIASLLLAFSLLYYILLFRLMTNYRQEKYRDISSQQTQPRAIEQKYQYENQRHRGGRIMRQGENIEQTKQNLFAQPSKDRPNIVYTYKQKSPQGLGKFNQIKPNRKEIHQSEIRSKYPPQQSFQQISPSKGSRRRNNIKYENDNNQFARQQNNFIGKYQGGSILASRGVEQKQNYNKKLSHEHFLAGQAKRRLDSPPKTNLNQELAIHNHIRSKYSN